MAKPNRNPKSKEILEESPDSELRLGDEIIDKSLVNADTDSKLEVHRKDTEYSNEKISKTKLEKQKKKTEKILAVSAKLDPRLKGHQETIAKYTGKLQNDKELEKTMNSLHKMQQNTPNLKWLLGKSGQALDKPTAIFDAVTAKYVTDSPHPKTKKEGIRFKTFKEVLEKMPEEKNIFKRIWRTIDEWFKYHSIKTQEPELLTYRTLSVIGGECTEIARKGLDLAENAENTLEEIQETRTKLATSINQKKIEAKQAAKKAKKLAAKWNADVANNLENIAKDGPKDFTNKVSRSAKETLEEVAEMGPVGIKAIKQGKFRGFGVTGTGIAFSTILLKSAFHSVRHGGNLDELKLQLTESSFWKDSAEILPIVGSVQSFRRLDDYSTEFPTWARYSEFLVNAGLDVAFIIPIALGTALGVLPGAALAGTRAFIGKLMVGGIKGVAKGIAKKGVKKVAEAGLEKGGKEFSKEAAEKAIKETGEKMAVKLSTKEAALSLTKNIFSKMTPKNWPTLWPKVWPHVKTQLGIEGIFMGATWAWNNFAKQKTIEVGTNVAMGQLTTQQQKAVKTVQKFRS